MLLAGHITRCCIAALDVAQSEDTVEQCSPASAALFLCTVCVSDLSFVAIPFH